MANTELCTYGNVEYMPKCGSEAKIGLQQVKEN